MKVLIVGDDNFTLTPCVLDNPEQWTAKISSAKPLSDLPSGPNEPPPQPLSSSSLSGEPPSVPPPSGESSVEQVKPWTVEVASCLSEDKIPFEYKSNHDKLKRRGISIHYSVNPALLRQYFTNFNPDDPDTESRPGPPFDVVLFVLPGLQYEGAPRFIDRKSDLFKLRLHLYFFALSKSSTVITRKNGAVMFLWLDQSSHTLANKDLPFPLVDIHKLGPFCKLYRSEVEDFRLNLSWGDYKTRWKPILHNVEVLHFPDYLEELKVYVFRNAPYVPTEEDNLKQQNSEEYNLLRIPQSICQWNRSVLTHVNELFHFNMRTCVPGEMLQVSKLSVKYDPRITGWRNSGHPPLPQQPPAQQPAQLQQPPAMPQATMIPQGMDPRLPNMAMNPSLATAASWGAAVGYLNGDSSQVNPYAAMAMTHPENLPPFVPNEIVMPYGTSHGQDNIPSGHHQPVSARNGAAYPAYETGLLSTLPAIPQVWPGQTSQVTTPFDGYAGSGPYGAPPTPFTNDFVEPAGASGNYYHPTSDAAVNSSGHDGINNNNNSGDRGFPSSWGDGVSGMPPNSSNPTGPESSFHPYYSGKEPPPPLMGDRASATDVKSGGGGHREGPALGGGSRYDEQKNHHHQPIPSSGSTGAPGPPPRSSYRDEPPYGNSGGGDYYGGGSSMPPRRMRKERRRSHDSYDRGRQGYRDEVYAPQRNKYRGASSRRESGRHDEHAGGGAPSSTSASGGRTDHRTSGGGGGYPDGGSGHRKSRPYR